MYKLLNMKSNFIKYSRYKLVEIKDTYYIMAVEGSEPSELSLENKDQMLVDFIKLTLEIANSIKPVIEISNYRVKNLSGVRKSKYDSILHECGRRLLRFVNDYGLFGIYNVRQQASFTNEKDSLTGRVYDSGRILSILTNDNKPFGNSLLSEYFNDKIPNNSQIPACQYYSYFFPTYDFSTSPDSSIPPYIDYSESVESIIFNEIFCSVMIHVIFSKEFSLNQPIFEDFSLDANQIKDKLKFTIKPRAITYNHDVNANFQDLKWESSSLIEFLSILYLSNLITHSGKYINVCAAKNCNKVFIADKALKYCPSITNKCMRAATTYNLRHKKKKIADEFSQGLTIEELSVKYNKEKAMLKNWIDEVIEKDKEGGENNG